MLILASYVRTLKRVGPFVSLFWLALMIWGLVTGLQFIKMADNDIPPTKGTKGYTTQKLLSREFPDLDRYQPTTVLLDCSELSLRHGEGLQLARNYFSQMNNTAVDWCKRNNKKTLLNRVVSYFSLVDVAGLEQVAESFISHDNHSMVQQLYIDTNYQQLHRYNLYEYLRDQQKELLLSSSNKTTTTSDCFVGLTSQDSLVDDANSVIIKDLEKADMFLIPVAFAVLAFMIKSWRLLLISLFNLGCVLMTSFATMRVIVNHTNLPTQSITPQFMEVMGLAMSIDYSLFFFSRYQQELLVARNKAKTDEMPRARRNNSQTYFSHDEVVRRALAHGGHVILVSGACLVVSFLGFLLLECEFITTIALANAITISLCMIVTLTNSPALLLVFPKFFSVPSDWTWCFRLLKSKISATSSDELGLESGGQFYSNNHHQQALLATTAAAAETAEDLEKMKKSFWYQITKVTTKLPWNIVVIGLMYGFAGFCASELAQMKTTTDFTQGLPHQSQSFHTLSHLRDGFGAGITQPFWILQTLPDTPGAVENNTFFDAGANVMSALVNESIGLGFENIHSLTLNKDQKISWDTARQLRAMVPAYEYEWELLVNADNSSMIHQITTPFDPNTGRTSSFVTDVYRVLDDANQQGLTGDFEFRFGGYKVYEADTIAFASKRIPRLILFTIVTVFVVMAVFLKSAFVPVRLLLTLVVPVAGTFGLTVGVYQKGWLAWLKWSALAKGDDGFYWDIPIMAFSIVVGLALDYDVFLITRVIEFRERGFSGRASVIRAVHDTASIITAAGIIMALAFSSMLFMSATAVHQMGWLLTSSVLIDTFIVRTMLVPAVMSFADRISWWPRTVPMVGLKNEFGQEGAS